MIPGADVLDACRPPAKTPAELRRMSERSALAAGMHLAKIQQCVPGVAFGALDDTYHMFGGWDPIAYELGVHPSQMGLVS